MPKICRHNGKLCRPLWAALWQNQQCGCAPSEDSDQPGHPPSLGFVTRRLIIRLLLLEVVNMRLVIVVNINKKSLQKIKVPLEMSCFNGKEIRRHRFLFKNLLFSSISKGLLTCINSDYSTNKKIQILHTKELYHSRASAVFKNGGGCCLQTPPMLGELQELDGHCISQRMICKMFTHPKNQTIPHK